MAGRQPIIAAAAILAVAACAPGGDAPRDGDTGTAEWSLAPEPLLSIGSVEGEPGYVFSGVAGVRLLPDGGVAVADRQSATLRVYDGEGALVREMGRQGEGPGEFEYVNDMRFHEPDTLLAFDSDTYRLTWFTTGGRLVETRSFRVDDGLPNLYMGTLGGDHVFAWIGLAARRDPTTITPDSMKVGRFGEDGSLADILAVDVGMRRRGGPVPFSPHFLHAHIGDTIVHTDGVGGILRRIGPDGEPLPPIRLDLDRPAPDPDAAFARLEPAVDSFALERLAGVREAPGTDTIPVISDLLVDDAGRLWVKPYVPETDSHWVGRLRTGGEWVQVDGDGGAIGQVSVPPGFRPMDIRGDRIAGVAWDELDVERVVVYELDRNQ